MISRRQFRILVLISLAWIFIAVLAAFLLPSDLNPILQSQLDAQLEEDWTAFDTFSALIVLALIISNIFLLFFKPWARLGYLILVPVITVLTAFDGPVIYSSFDSFSNEVDIFISGILWSTLLFSGIKNEFSDKSST